MSKSKRFFRGNLIFLFVVAFLVGVIAKKTIGNHVRIGFDDPSTLIQQGQLYDIDELEQNLLRSGMPAETSSNSEQVESIGK